MGFRANLNFRKFKVAVWETVTWRETQNKKKEGVSAPVSQCTPVSHFFVSPDFVKFRCC